MVADFCVFLSNASDSWWARRGTAVNGGKVVKSILHISSGLVILLSSFPLVSDAQWVQTQGPYGGPGGTLACKGSTVFLASGWGVFRSSDVGATWTATNLNLVVLKEWPPIACC